MEADVYRHILSLDAIAAGVVAGDGSAEWVSPGLGLMMGRSPSSLVGTRVSAWFDAARAPMSLDDLRSVDGPVRWDATLAVEGTVPIWVQVVLTRLSPGQARWAVVLTDVHEREERFGHVSGNELMARLCLDLIDQAVLLVSPTLGVERSNPAVRKILGYDGFELFDMWNDPAWQVYDANAVPVARDDFAPMRAVLTGEAVRDEINWIRHADGQWVRVRLSAYPFAWTDEVVVAITDITEYTSASAPRPSP